jgi:signal transduction histidine kinase/CheY-like chemotaxis protein
MAQEMMDFPSSFSTDVQITRELKEAAFRSLVTLSGASILGWYLLANLFRGLGDVVQVSLVGLAVGLAVGLGFLLAERWFGLARMVWLVGLAAANVLAVLVFRRAELATLLALLPVLAMAVTFRWQWGAAAVAGLALLMAWLGPAAGLDPLPALPSLIVPLLGGLALLAGWIYARTFLSIALRSVSNYRRAREELEQLREERVHFVQTQEDFAQANRDLARMTERLAAMTHMAEEARRIKEEFVARVSHELRTPLNMVIGFSEVIMNSPKQYGESIPPALLADVDTILRNSQHLSRLVDDILDLSHVEAGRMALTKEWASLPEMIAEAVSAVKGLFDTKGLYLRLQVAPDLPPVFCDTTRVRQVIINLLGNAARFTEKGGVTIQAGLANGEVQISVADTGLGIAPPDQLRVFQPFQQVDSILRRHKGGTGLGLTISKQFVEMHGGKMWLESQPGQGTTFFFTLPVRSTQLVLDEAATAHAAGQPTEAPVSPEVQTEAGASTAEKARRWINRYYQYDPRTRLANLPPTRSDPRYVVVEDENNLQRLITRYADHMEVVGVRHVADAVAEVRRSPAQALILNAPVDLTDPALQEQFGRLPFGTPVISCWLPGKEEAARRLGVVYYMIKPVSSQDVLSALEKVPGPPRRILVADDEPEILRLFVRMLSACDPPYQVLQAQNGRRALHLLRTRQPDVMLLDLIMPEMSGFQVLQEKTQDPTIRDIPVIIVSSQDPRGGVPGETGESVMSRSFAVTRGSGLSVHELLRCIQTVTNILVPEEPLAGRGPVETPPEKPVS